jgi:hypothetical protein
VNERALQLEETRKRYEADLAVIFKSIEQENMVIAKLLVAEKRPGSKG